MPKDATFIPADLRTVEGVNTVAAAALQVLGGLDILVNNAGAARVHLPASSAISDEEWLDSLNINFLSAVRMTNAVLSALKESTAGASIINVSAVGAGPALGPLLHYASAKAALNTYTVALGQELAPSKIRVNIVTPGPVSTPGANLIRKVSVGRHGHAARGAAAKGSSPHLRRGRGRRRDGRLARIRPGALDHHAQLFRRWRHGGTLTLHWERRLDDIAWLAGRRLPATAVARRANEPCHKPDRASRLSTCCGRRSASAGLQDTASAFPGRHPAGR
nr:SDR family NAD(P)-dependent oxidoreductase [Singulisphaera sp. GP187]